MQLCRCCLFRGDRLCWRKTNLNLLEASNTPQGAWVPGSLGAWVPGSLGMPSAPGNVSVFMGVQGKDESVLVCQRVDVP
eukprot:12579715-Alexandrium_andersonii.AAC.1